MLSIIIVNFNTSHLVKDCVKSINTYPPKGDFEIIIVDNNSAKEEKEILKTLDYKVIFLSENLGFSKANNIGVQEAKGDYLLFLNPDTVVLKNTLEVCLSCLKGNKSIGALGCRVNLEDGTLDMACKRSLPTIKNTLGHYLKLNGKIKYFSGYRRLDLKDDYVGEIECLVGAFIMMPKNVFEEIGGFCEDYFMYGEDIELCFQVLKSGYKIFYLGEVGIIHKKGASGRNKKTKKAFYESMKIYYDKHKKNKLFDIFVYLGIKVAQILGL